MLTISPDRPVLVVDDGLADRLILEHVLAASTLANPMLLASCGSDALERVASEPLALVLLDVNLGGGMDGFEVLRQLRARKNIDEHLPIVMLTSSTAPRDRARAEALGADGYLEKPAGIETFIELIDKSFVSG